MTSRRQVRISNLMGIHVRPATALAETARRFKAAVALIKKGQRVDAKSCIELLTLAATQGTELEVYAEGEDAEAAVESVASLISSGFGEK